MLLYGKGIAAVTLVPAHAESEPGPRQELPPSCSGAGAWLRFSTGSVWRLDDLVYLIQTSFKYLQGWRLNHFPGQSVPMLDNPLGEEKFPNIQSKPPLAQLEAISSCPITCYLGEETDPHLSTTSFQVVVESDEVSPQPPFLQAKQSQLPQPLLIRLLLQTLHQLRCPSLYALQYLNIPLVVGGPKLNTVFEVLVAEEGATGVASVRRRQKLPLCPTEPVPASSKMDPPLAKAEPISDSGSASVITYLRRGKNCCTTAARGERSENM
ncbi:hypothetical protein QYF61_014462 [Mycteria americana]|uniref:Uncharacterized protein n=1 Tax=Mycteria americana TaxID=33587 RepID=A0AAN7MPI7_MYCAM|nr:hypothetical protein QYF61_014462 [Mycteria americana]